MARTKHLLVLGLGLTLVGAAALPALAAVGRAMSVASGEKTTLVAAKKKNKGKKAKKGKGKGKAEEADTGDAADSAKPAAATTPPPPPPAAAPVLDLSTIETDTAAAKQELLLGTSVEDK